MANTNLSCKHCVYNITKTKGGFGKLCNGYTVKQYGRCPEWRITESRDNTPGLKFYSLCRPRTKNEIDLKR